MWLANRLRAQYYYSAGGGLCTVHVLVDPYQILLQSRDCIVVYLFGLCSVIDHPTTPVPMDSAILIKNGAVYDPINEVFNKKLDLFFKQGKTALLGEQLDRKQLAHLASTWTEFDATRCLVD